MIGMADEPAKIILGDTAISAVERTARRRWFGRGRDREALPFTHCENCGAELVGPHCAQCGQPAIDYRRSFRHVIVDVLDSFLNWDSKFFATLGLLIVKPWRLTNEFLAGKRVRYLHPLRLYLLASILFFFAVNYSAKGLKFEPGKISDKGRDKVAAEIEKKRDEIEKELEKENLTSDQRRKAQAALDYLTKPSPAPSATASTQENPPPTIAPPQTSVTPPVSSPQTSPPISPAKEASPERRTYGGPGDRPFMIFDENEKSSTPFEKWLEARAKEKMGEHGTKMGLFI